MFINIKVIFGTKKETKTRDIGLQERGQRIWTLAKENGTVHHYLGAGNWKRYSGSAVNISVNSNGDVYVVNAAKNIYVNNCPAIPRDELAQVENQLYVASLSGRKTGVQWVVDQQFTPDSYVLEYAKEDGLFEAIETISASPTTDISG